MGVKNKSFLRCRCPCKRNQLGSWRNTTHQSNANLVAVTVLLLSDNKIGSATLPRRSALADFAEFFHWTTWEVFAVHETAFGCDAWHPVPVRRDAEVTTVSCAARPLQLRRASAVELLCHRLRACVCSRRTCPGKLPRDASGATCRGSPARSRRGAELYLAAVIALLRSSALFSVAALMTCAPAMGHSGRVRSRLILSCRCWGSPCCRRLWAPSNARSFLRDVASH